MSKVMSIQLYSFHELKKSEARECAIRFLKKMYREESLKSFKADVNEKIEALGCDLTRFTFSVDEDLHTITKIRVGASIGNANAYPIVERLTTHRKDLFDLYVNALTLTRVGFVIEPNDDAESNKTHNVRYVVNDEIDEDEKYSKIKWALVEIAEFIHNEIDAVLDEMKNAFNFSQERFNNEIYNTLIGRLTDTKACDYLAEQEMMFFRGGMPIAVNKWRNDDIDALLVPVSKTAYRKALEEAYEKENNPKPPVPKKKSLMERLTFWR